ncbi:MAG: exonuclease SbcCD subunit D [Oscillospiraceae bacterium]|jgi:exonuclease SbcD|nr:exonuclease SbcCD subunit D [Oscillospiraceae bacterium]
MKWFHLSDLHLGKRLCEVPLLSDQAHILSQILALTAEERPDGVLIAGDVYDKPVPSAEVVGLLDDFLVRLSRQGVPAYLISGNHDSAERLSFGGRLMAAGGVHVAPVYSGRVEPIVLADQYGPVHLYLMPFLKPAHVRRFFPEASIESYTDAVAAVVSAMEIDPAVRNVLVAHQFVTGSVRSASEEVSVGGTDNVDVSVFDGFDYVALGHLHSPQWAGRDTVRYCGTPLAYSFPEAEQEKSVTVVELKEKGTVSLRTLPLTPLRRLGELRGTYEELTCRQFYEGTDYQSRYLRVVLTDEEDVVDAAVKLRMVYPGLMQVAYDNHRTQAAGVPELESERRSPLELLEEFYEGQNGQPMGDAQRQLARELMEQIWEGEV